LVGLETMKTMLNSLIRGPNLQKHVLQPFGVDMVKKTALLYGLPGCGKTLLANWLAYENNYNLLKVETSSLLSKYHGETEKNIMLAFEV
jgi:SpoVK/Ycf46/Vps4 family AAA+-type ATPase